MAAAHNKTIVQVFDYSRGLGDLLRGTICLAQYAKQLNMNFKIDVSRHHIAKYLGPKDDLGVANAIVISMVEAQFTDQRRYMYECLKEFKRSNHTNIYLTCSHFYNENLLSQDIKNTINNFFTFKPEYYRKAAELFPLDDYEVLHIRLTDENFDTDFRDNGLFLEVLKLQLPPNTIVLSNNNSVKKRINMLFGFHYIDGEAVHSRSAENSDLEKMVFDYIILSRSRATYCFSYYEHGSSFSEQCSVLNDVSYTLYAV
jgi:hypothetical protein